MPSEGDSEIPAKITFILKYLSQFIHAMSDDFDFATFIF